MPQILDWPPALRPAEVDWGLLVPQEVQRGIDGSPQVDIVGAPRWRVMISTGPLRRDEVPEWEAWVDRLRGGVNRARIWDWRREAPLGPAGGAPIVTFGGTGNSLVTQGWTLSTQKILKAGSWVGLNGELKRLSQSINSDGGGVATITFEPPLRSAVPANAPLLLVKPTALFIMDGDPPSMKQQGARFPGLSLTFEEVFA